MIEQISFDQGVHVRGTPLWVDALRKRALCLMTGLGAALPPAHRRAVASPELCAALARAGYAGSVLPAPYDRWIGVGGREVKLLAAAERGGAVAVVRSGRERIVLAGLLRQARVRWPHGELLVAVAPALEHHGASLDEVARGVALFAAQAVSERVAATVLVDSIEPALDLHARLADRGVHLIPGGVLAKLCGPSPEAHGAALALMGARVGKGRVALVETGIATWAGLRPFAATPAVTFHLRWYGDWPTLRHAARMTEARAVVLVGPIAEAVARTHLPDVDLRVLAPSRQLGLEIEVPGSL